MNTRPLAFLREHLRWGRVVGVVLAAVVAVVVAGVYFRQRVPLIPFLVPGEEGHAQRGAGHDHEAGGGHAHDHGQGGQGAHPDEHGHEHEGHATEVVLPKEKWEAAGLRVAEAALGEVAATKWVTGKLTLNEDRTAHIYSLVDGLVHHVNVHFGEQVKKGQVLAVIDSKEVGFAKLELVKNRLKRDFAKVNYDFMREIDRNTQDLIKTLESMSPPSKQDLTKVQMMYRDRMLGENRAKLLTTYADLYRAHAAYERLKPLANQGAAAGKQLIEAEAELEAARASFHASLEQLSFTAYQEALRAEQEYRQAEQAVQISQSQLFILGYTPEDLQKIDIAAEGEAISHYEIRAPFDGTIIAKDVVLAERVGPDTQMFELADLSTLWVQADVFQSDFLKIQELGEQLQFRIAGTNEIRQAVIFSTGSVFDPKTRTIRVRALVDNSDHSMKAGMFVEIALPGEGTSGVVVVPSSALQEVEGEDVVFVQVAPEKFEKREVKVGMRGNDKVEIREGLRPGEQVVVAGGFALKSELMKGSISHSH